MFLYRVLSRPAAVGPYPRIGQHVWDGLRGKQPIAVSTDRLVNSVCTPVNLLLGLAVPLLTWYGHHPCCFVQDDGVSFDYKGNKFVTQSLSASLDSNGFNVTIAAAVGTCAGAPASRAHSLQFRGLVVLPSAVTLNGKPIPAGNATPVRHCGRELCDSFVTD